MADDANRKWKPEAEGGNNQHENNGKSEAKILINDPPGAAGEGEGEDDIFKVVAHQYNIGRFHGYICASRTHGDAHSGRGEGGGIVHSISDHGHRTDVFEFLDDFYFIFGKQIGVEFIDPDLPGNGLGHPGVVAC